MVKVTKNKAKKSDQSKTKFTTPQYLEKAEQMLQAFEPEMAERVLRKAVENDPNNAQALDMFGQVLADNGNQEEAIEVLRRSVDLSPNEGDGKFMCLGQLSSFPDSVTFLHQGIALMLRQQQAQGASLTQTAAVALKHKLCSGYCALVEIYTSDACFEANAESESEKYATLALQQFECVQAHCALSNVRLSQQRHDEAKQHIAKAVELLHKELDVDAKPLQEAANDTTPHTTFDVRLQLARMCLEVAQIEDAHDVLEACLVEDDENAEVWMLNGVVCQEQGNGPGARECLQHALQLAQKQGLGPDVVGVITEQMKREFVEVPQPDDSKDDNDDDDGADDEEMG